MVAPPTRLAASAALGIALTTSSVAGQDPAFIAANAAQLNPLVDFPDPFILREGSVYYALATGAVGHHIQAAVSSDLASWRRVPDALPRLPVWASSSARLTWAPSVLKRDDKYVLFYTARDRRTGFQCISRAVSVQPQGPYVDSSTQPFICQSSGAESFCGSIDPSPFVDTDGTAYLYWKSDENAAKCRTAPRIWVQRLANDGMSVEGVPTVVLALDRAWESQVVEGPSMLRQASTYFLFYSANWYASAQYAIGYATCNTPVGPCAKTTIDTPWLKSEGTMLGPGGQEFFRDATGQAYITYHAWTAPNTTYTRGGARSLHIDPLQFIDGVPKIAQRDHSE
jgi:beta-xylosidase